MRYVLTGANKMGTLTGQPVMKKSLDAGLKTPICQAITKITKNQLNRG